MAALPSDLVMTVMASILVFAITFAAWAVLMAPSGKRRR